MDLRTVGVARTPAANAIIGGLRPQRARRPRVGGQAAGGLCSARQLRPCRLEHPRGLPGAASTGGCKRSRKRSCPAHTRSLPTACSPPGCLQPNFAAPQRQLLPVWALCDPVPA